MGSVFYYDNDIANPQLTWRLYATKIGKRTFKDYTKDKYNSDSSILLARDFITSGLSFSINHQWTTAPELINLLNSSEVILEKSEGGSKQLIETSRLLFAGAKQGLAGVFGVIGNTMKGVTGGKLGDKTIGFAETIIGKVNDRGRSVNVGRYGTTSTVDVGSLIKFYAGSSVEIPLQLSIHIVDDQVKETWCRKSSPSYDTLESVSDKLRLLIRYLGARSYDDVDENLIKTTMLSEYVLATNDINSNSSGEKGSNDTQNPEVKFNGSEGNVLSTTGASIVKDGSLSTEIATMINFAPHMFGASGSDYKVSTSDVINNTPVNGTLSLAMGGSKDGKDTYVINNLLCTGFSCQVSKEKNKFGNPLYADATVNLTQQLTYNSDTLNKILNIRG